ncbi:winged helix-turn-helix transcriptional regulator [Clostridioides difficile]|uniref:winged helix-turn-helix transcriptional regulator n=1 Tax=Clostridioides difficile TaxID=1496 RepID=UPI002ED609C4
MKIRAEYTCPLEIVHDIIKGKWKTILIFELRQSNKTFSELQHNIYGINQKQWK